MKNKKYIFFTLIFLVILALPITLSYYTVQWWNYNRIRIECLLLGVWPESKGYLTMKEKASSGNEPLNRNYQRKLIYDYSYAGFDISICLPHNDDKFYEFLETTARQGWIESKYAFSYVIGKVWYDLSPVFDISIDTRKSFAYLEDAANGNIIGASHDLSIAYLAGKWGDVHFTCREKLNTDEDVNNRGSIGKIAEEEVLCSRSDEFLNGKWGDNALQIGKNYVESMKWLEKAVGQKEPSAVYDMGRRYRYGNYGAEINYSLAFDLFMRSATEHRDPRAMVELAWLYVDGKGVEADLDQANLWMERALLRNKEMIEWQGPSATQAAQQKYSLDAIYMRFQKIVAQQPDNIK